MTLATSDDALHDDARTAQERARWRAVASEHGIASLRHTHWLDEEFRAYDDAPGVWAGRGGRIVGRRLSQDEPDAELTLAPGEEAAFGRLLLRALDRDGAPALRVLDPDAPTRVRLRGIHSFARDDAWVLRGAFVPAPDGETRVVRSVDGYEREQPAVGTVAVTIGGAPVALTVSGGAKGLSAVFADGTSGADAYRFRFLPIDPPDADGAVEIDFNRAYLPPCAFSDEYVCPLPPAGNRLAVRVEAGERLPDLAPLGDTDRADTN